MTCELCHQFPHAAGCPNAPEPEVVCVCDVCGAEICKGDLYYAKDVTCICDDCANRRAAWYVLESLGFANGIAE